MKKYIIFGLLYFLFTVSTAAQTDLPENFDVQGHRGARGLKPENTLPSFETALDLGVTTLELDLHFSADGVVVVWHDDAITNDKCYINPDSVLDVPDPDSLIWQGDKLYLSNLTWEEIQAYRCDHNPDVGNFPQQDNLPTHLAGDDYHIPSLNELFDFVEAYTNSDEKTVAQIENALTIQFNIETKRKVNDDNAIGDDFDGINPGAFEIAILEIIEAYDVQEQVVIQSFDHRSLWAIHSVNEDIRLAALTSRISPDLETYAERGAIIWSPNANDITPARLQTAHDLGLLVIPWTINDVEIMQQLINLGVDGIITDRPDLLLDLNDE